MESMFSSGHIADIALLVMLAEAGVLYAYTLKRAGTLSFRPFLANLAAGALLVVAVRLALVGAAWRWIALALALSLLAHGYDLSLRLRSHVTRA
jgi:hypothetical protein